MLAKLTQTISQFLLSTKEESNLNPTLHDNALAIAALLCEVSNADEDISEIEEQCVIDTLSKLLLVSTEEANALLIQGKASSNKGNSLFEFTTELENISQEDRVALIQSMWEVAYSDNHLDPVEEGIIRKVAKLLYVEHSQFIKTKLVVNQQL